MSFLTERRSRQLVLLALITMALVLGGAMAAYADSTDGRPLAAIGIEAQGDATPTGTPAAESGVQSAVL